MTEKVTEKAPDMEIMAKYHLPENRTLISFIFRQNIAHNISCLQKNEKNGLNMMKSAIFINFLF